MDNRMTISGQRIDIRYSKHYDSQLLIVLCQKVRIPIVQVVIITLIIIYCNELSQRKDIE
jgi:hypothetical protein